MLAHHTSLPARSLSSRGSNRPLATRRGLRRGLQHHVVAAAAEAAEAEGGGKGDLLLRR